MVYLLCRNALECNETFPHTLVRIELAPECFLHSFLQHAHGAKVVEVGFGKVVEEMALDGRTAVVVVGSNLHRVVVRCGSGAEENTAALVGFGDFALLNGLRTLAEIQHTEVLLRDDVACAVEYGPLLAVLLQVSVASPKHVAKVIVGYLEAFLESHATQQVVDKRLDLGEERIVFGFGKLSVLCKACEIFLRGLAKVSFVILFGKL